MADKMSITKSQLHQNWKKRLEGKNLREIVARYKDADYFLKKDDLLDPETIIYEVVLKESKPDEGHLNWGYICVYPGRVSDQYFCTQGHFNTNPRAEEYLLCMQGDGLIMLMDENGSCWCEELEEGSLHHVDAGLAYRLINLGDDELLLSCVRPSNTSDDEEKLKANPFSCHVYDDDGEMAIFVELDENREEQSQEDFEALLKM